MKIIKSETEIEISAKKKLIILSVINSKKQKMLKLSVKSKFNNYDFPYMHEDEFKNLLSILKSIEV
jgi:hypothetical protein